LRAAVVAAEEETKREQGKRVKRRVRTFHSKLRVRRKMKKMSRKRLIVILRIVL
jgi:hypothetical protein